MKGLQTVEYRSADRPPVQTHVFFLIDAFVYFLLSSLSPPREHTILTNHYCTPLEKGGPFILFNIEQLTRPTILEQVYQRALQSDIVEVWDYSETNVALLRTRGVAARYVPVQTPEPCVAAYKAFYASQPKLYDIGFCGVVPDRRMKILKTLQEKGYKVLLLSNVYGTQRDLELSRCRIQLNIHQSDEHRIFESIRCDPWLSAGMPIVSEESLEQDPRCIVASYDTLVETVVAVLKQVSCPETQQKLVLKV